jgi:hypothetical protein
MKFLFTLIFLFLLQRPQSFAATSTHQIIARSGSLHSPACLVTPQLVDEDILYKIATSLTAELRKSNKVRQNILYSAMFRQLKNEMRQTNHIYDVIIVGGGVGGSKLAQSLAINNSDENSISSFSFGNLKVLVIDASDYPSSFGVDREFGLLSGKNFGDEERITAGVPQTKKGSPSACDRTSLDVGWEVFAKLYASGADVLLGEKVVRIISKDDLKFPSFKKAKANFEVTTISGANFYSKFLIDSTGNSIERKAEGVTLAENIKENQHGLYGPSELMSTFHSLSLKRKLELKERFSPSGNPHETPPTLVIGSGNAATMIMKYIARNLTSPTKKTDANRLFNIIGEGRLSDGRLEEDQTNFKKGRVTSVTYDQENDVYYALCSQPNSSSRPEIKVGPFKNIIFATGIKGNSNLFPNNVSEKKGFFRLQIKDPTVDESALYPVSIYQAQDIAVEISDEIKAQNLAENKANKDQDHSTQKKLQARQATIDQLAASSSSIPIEQLARSFCH